MNFNYVSALNFSKYKAAGKPKFRGWVNALADFINQKFTDEDTLAVDTLNVTDIAADTLSLTSGVVEKEASVTLTATEIVGTAAGDIGSTGGAILVAAPGAGYLLEFVSAVLIYDFDTAAYTGGGDDLVVRQGTTAVSAAIAGADLLEDTADDIAFVSALSAADIKLTSNSTLNLYSTAWTQPGTAAGTLKVNVKYRLHTV